MVRRAGPHRTASSTATSSCCGATPCLGRRRRDRRRPAHLAPAPGRRRRRRATATSSRRPCSTPCGELPRSALVRAVAGGRPDRARRRAPAAPGPRGRRGPRRRRPAGPGRRARRRRPGRRPAGRSPSWPSACSASASPSCLAGPRRGRAVGRGGRRASAVGRLVGLPRRAGPAFLAGWGGARRRRSASALLASRRSLAAPGGAGPSSPSASAPWCPVRAAPRPAPVDDEPTTTGSARPAARSSRAGGRATTEPTDPGRVPDRARAGRRTSRGGPAGTASPSPWRRVTSAGDRRRVDSGTRSAIARCST